MVAKNITIFILCAIYIATVRAKSKTTIEIDGTAVWVMINSKHVASDFGKPAPYKYTHESRVTASQSQIEQIALQRSSSTTSSISLTADVGINIFSVSTSASMSWTSSTLNSVMRESRSSKIVTKKEKHEIGPVDVDPGKTIYIFEKKLKFPGGILPMSTLQFRIGWTKTPPVLNEKVRMRVPITVTRYQFLKSFSVKYYGGKVKSSNFIKMAQGSNNDINKGFGGKYVYLEPLWTEDPRLAASRVSIRIGKKVKYLRDLAKGAGGTFRYVLTHRDRRNRNKIIEVKMWDGRLYRTPDGWNGRTIDINKGRRGRYLYIIWKTTRV